jgi:glutathione peroxidase
LTSDHYTQLVELYEKYQSRGLQILAFPCGQFFNQELKTDLDIKNDVLKRFGVSFPLFSKTKVNGPDCHPIYKYLKFNSEELNTKKGLKNIPWNFTKILVNKNGEVVKVVKPGTKPKIMEDDIEKLLNQ